VAHGIDLLESRDGIYESASISPLRMAYLMSAVRVRSPNLAIKFCRCRSTVYTLMSSARAIPVRGWIV
jgi:hypothetical protein